MGDVCKKPITGSWKILTDEAEVAKVARKDEHRSGE